MIFLLSSIVSIFSSSRLMLSVLWVILLFLLSLNLLTCWKFSKFDFLSFTGLSFSMKFPRVWAAFRMFWWITNDVWVTLDLLRVAWEIGVSWTKLAREEFSWCTGLKVKFWAAGDTARFFCSFLRKSSGGTSSTDWFYLCTDSAFSRNEADPFFWSSTFIVWLKFWFSLSTDAFFENLFLTRLLLLRLSLWRSVADNTFLFRVACFWFCTRFAEKSLFEGVKMSSFASGRDSKL